MTSSPEQRTGPTDVGDDEEASASGATRPIHPEERRPSPPEPCLDSGVAPLLAGEPIGRYLVLEDLARGGMSIVYVAYDPKLDRRVALKVMRPDATERPQRAQARLLREAQAMAQLAHPNVVRVYDVGVLGERVYMAMELVEGQTLRDWISSRARGWREIVGVLRQVGRGLAAAHAVGLVHLDVKPHNILVGHDGEVRVVDFGLARTPQEAGERIPSGPEIVLPLYDEVTHAGMVMGTPGYMAPEQLDGSSPDARSDQFSFCVTAWEALYGERPYPGRRLDEYREAIARGQIVEPPEPGRVPPRLRRRLERGLSIRPGQRYPNMGELLDALAEDPQRLWRRGGMLLGFAGVVAASTFALTSPGDDSCAEQHVRLEGTWDDARREQVAARLTRVDVAQSGAMRPMAEALLGGLQGYADAWVDAATEVCRATPRAAKGPDARLDVRIHCLEHRRRALQAATDLLLEPEASAGASSLPLSEARWDRVIANLPPIDSCRDMTSLYHVGRPPTDAGLVESIARIDRLLARSWAMMHVGRTIQALEAVDTALRMAEAEVHEYDPIMARIQRTRGMALGLLDRGDEAEQAGFEAVWRADVEGMHSVRASALTDLVFHVGVLGGRADEAEHLGQNGLWIVRHLAPEPRIEAQLLANLGAVDARAGRYERARDRMLGAIELRCAEGMNEGVLVEVNTLVGLGVVQHQLGDHERALHTFREARHKSTARFGPGHPSVMVAYENEAVALHALERYEDALGLLAQVQAQAEQAGEDAPSRAKLHAVFSAIYIELERYESARALLEHAREELEDRDVRPLLLGVIYGNLALVRIEQGAPDEGIVLARQARTIFGKLVGPEHIYHAWLLGLLARAHGEQGHARRSLESAWASWTLLVAADEREDGMVEPEFRAEAALAIARALSAPAIQSDPELVARMGDGQSASAWAERARIEAEAGGRAAASVRRRVRQWLAAPSPAMAEDRAVQLSSIASSSNAP